MTMRRVRRRRLKVATVLFDFINDEVLPGINLSESAFWTEFDAILHRLAPENRALLARRTQLQAQIDAWHHDRRHQPLNIAAYKAFLGEIGYLEREGGEFSVDTDQLDPEMSTIAGPQLVVPVMNARFALNAANARWGSLYDAIYGSDVLPGAVPRGGYDPARGAAVIAFVRAFLDKSIPLTVGSYNDARAFEIKDGQLRVTLADGSRTTLSDTRKFAGYLGAATSPASILFVNHGLHIEICVNREHPIGRNDAAGVCDVILESAVTTIMDLEDSIAAVDAEDKTAAYRNWLGLMKGTLSAQFEKGGRRMTRHLDKDRHYLGPAGVPFLLPGRSLMLVRNVGHMPTTDSILLDGDIPAPEGIVDAMITSVIALHNLRHRRDNSRRPNSAMESIYIVKPKMHGSEEVAFADSLFDRVEDALQLKRHTIKIGIMDEERRTSLNLKECIRAARHRIAFINTGFLDRTGDEIHTSMEAGPMIRKNDMKNTRWIKAYEDRSVRIGLRCGLGGRAQIGKGMWAMPDRMADMLAQKIAHPQAGASTAWVPSPTAATLHAMHYHEVDVGAQQAALKNAPCDMQDDLLSLPLIDRNILLESDIRQELENNIQGILGYVVRWIDQGIGCSKVPDINGVALMEDRATLRISSQHIANWLRHNICTQEQVLATAKKMAKVVDGQNADDKNYHPMSVDFDGSIAFRAACSLIFDGCTQPSGYTELILHRFRAMAKIARKQPAPGGGAARTV
ncbi:MAG: malate synthase G [Alphaproteobacteria bacterium]|nr:malate synthase G [Alphaproteobacteria bacterium]